MDEGARGEDTLRTYVSSQDSSRNKCSSSSGLRRFVQIDILCVCHVCCWNQGGVRRILLDIVHRSWRFAEDFSTEVFVKGGRYINSCSH